MSALVDMARAAMRIRRDCPYLHDEERGHIAVNAGDLRILLQAVDGVVPKELQDKCNGIYKK